MPAQPQKSAGNATGIGFVEFVCLIAALIAVNALGVDAMLPALPDIGHSLGILQENDRQWVISAYLLGFGSAQIIYGPLADRYGRRPITQIGLALYIVTSLAAAMATSFPMLIALRAAQGAGAACTRALAVAIVRDCYSGRQMARVMSLTFIVFLLVPMLAPTVGAAILTVAPWQAVFLLLAAFASVIVIWFSIRLGETLHPEYRRAINPHDLLEAARRIITTPVSLGYTVALAMSFGAMLGFINSAQQIIAELFNRKDIFPLLFALSAGGLALAALVNSRIVERFGSRLISHSALVAYILINAAHLLALKFFGESLVMFMAFQFVVMFCSGLMGSNFGAMAMEPMGAIAGTAAAIQGTISTLGAALVGLIIGQSFNGSTTPVVAGYFVASIVMLGVVLYAERGRLFRAHHITAEPVA